MQSSIVYQISAYHWSVLMLLFSDNGANRLLVLLNSLNIEVTVDTYVVFYFAKLYQLNGGSIMKFLIL